MNPLFQAMMGNAPTNGMANFMQMFQQFRNTFRGNPQQQVQQMLQTGRITQEDYNRAVQMAQQFQGLLK